MKNYAGIVAAFALSLATAAAPALAQTENARGLDFRSYLSIRKGMTEGEVIGIAGRPDMQAEQGVVRTNQGWTERGELMLRSDHVELALRTYTYLPTAAEPYVTTITFLGGRVSEVKRDKKS